MDFGNPNADLHVSKASILPIKPRSQPVSLVSVLEIKLIKSNYSFLPFFPPGIQCLLLSLVDLPFSTSGASSLPYTDCRHHLSSVSLNVNP